MGEGFLVLADISGFTEFVTATELEHGPPIIAALLESVIAGMAPPLSVLEIEGDAVFALASPGSVEPPASLLSVLGDAQSSFRERQGELDKDESCSCNVCRGVLRLRLKMICHYGPFLEQSVGGRPQLAGREVILVHRLLKNTLDRDDDYTLVTSAGVEAMALDTAGAGFVAHREWYEHLGEVECFVRASVCGAIPPPTPAADEAEPNALAVGVA